MPPTEPPQEQAERDLTTLSASRALVQRLKVLAVHHGITLPEVLDRFAAPAVAREYRRVLAEMDRNLSAQPK